MKLTIVNVNSTWEEKELYLKLLLETLLIQNTPTIPSAHAASGSQVKNQSQV